MDNIQNGLLTFVFTPKYIELQTKMFVFLTLKRLGGGLKGLKQSSRRDT